MGPSALWNLLASFVSSVQAKMTIILQEFACSMGVSCPQLLRIRELSRPMRELGECGSAIEELMIMIR